MSLSDDLDRENGDLEWREYDAEGTNAAVPACDDCGEHHQGYGDCELTGLREKHPTWCKCQRVCGGDQ